VKKSNRAIDSDARQALDALAGARHRGRYAATNPRIFSFVIYADMLD